MSSKHLFTYEDIHILTKLAGRDLETEELVFLWNIHSEKLQHRPYFETLRRLNLGAKRDSEFVKPVKIYGEQEFISKSGYYDSRSDLAGLTNDALELSGKGYELAIQTRLYSGKPKRRLNAVSPVHDCISDLIPKENMVFTSGVRNVTPPINHRSVNGHYGDLYLLFSSMKADKEILIESSRKLCKQGFILSSHHFTGESIAPAIYDAWKTHSSGFEYTGKLDNFYSGSTILVCTKPGNEKFVEQSFQNTGWSIQNVGRMVETTEFDYRTSDRSHGFILTLATFQYDQHLPENHNRPVKEIIRKPVILKNSKKTGNYTKTALDLFRVVQKKGLCQTVHTEKTENNDLVAASVPYNSSWCRLDPRNGGRLAVASAIRNLVCNGYKPFGIAIHNILPPGNSPDHWKGIELLQGQEECIRFFEMPIISRKYSTAEGRLNQAILAYGSLQKTNPITPAFKRDGDFISILGSHRGELGGSSYLHMIGKESPEYILPALDQSMDLRLQDVIQTANMVGLIKSAIMIGAGGLSTAIFRSLQDTDPEFGARVFFSRKLLAEELLFGETQGLIMVSLDERDIMEFERICIKIGIPSTTIGRVTGDGEITVNDQIKLTRNTLENQVKQ